MLKILNKYININKSIRCKKSYKKIISSFLFRIKKMNNKLVVIINFINIITYLPKHDFYNSRNRNLLVLIKVDIYIKNSFFVFVC